jgi:hypothetical protein
MPWGFAIGAAGALGAAAIGSSASQSAANTQASAAQSATGAELAMFNQEQANVAPWLSAGQGSLAQLQRALGLAPTQVGGPGPAPQAVANVGVPGAVPRPMTGQALPGPGRTAQPGVGGIPLAAGGTPDLTSILRSTPGYQWDVSQGQQAILDQRSALGGVNSGATLKALSDYTANQADNTYNQYINNLMQLSNTGANAGLGVAGIGAGVGANIGSNMIGAGNALAAGQIGSANAIAGGLGGAYNNFLMAQALQNQNPGVNTGWGYPAGQTWTGADLTNWGTGTGAAPGGW